MILHLFDNKELNKFFYLKYYYYYKYLNYKRE